MNGFEELANYFYSEGDLLMFTARVLTYLFVIEIGAYIVSILSTFRKV